jgi:hypothetical protein
VCKARMSDEAAYADVQTRQGEVANSQEVKVISRQWDHSKCQEHLPSNAGGKKISLAFLETCTAVWREAHLFPYSSNAFIFRSWYEFECFAANGGTAKQIAAIRDVSITTYLEISLDVERKQPYESKAWPNWMDQQWADNLVNVRNMHMLLLVINNDIMRVVEEGTLTINLQPAAIGQVSQLSLKTFTALIEPLQMCHNSTFGLQCPHIAWKPRFIFPQASHAMGRPTRKRRVTLGDLMTAERVKNYLLGES